MKKVSGIVVDNFEVVDEETRAIDEDFLNESQCHVHGGVVDARVHTKTVST